MKPMEHHKAIIVTCVTALLWSICGLNIKLIDWSPYAIAGGRSIFCCTAPDTVYFKKQKQEDRPLCDRRRRLLRGIQLLF